MAAADDTTPPPTKKTSWKGSREKRQLRKDILEGLVDEEMTAEEVYDMRGGIYHKFVFKNFKNNLKNLRSFLKREQERSFFDSLAFYNDKRSKRLLPLKPRSIGMGLEHKNGSSKTSTMNSICG